MRQEVLIDSEYLDHFDHINISIISYYEILSGLYHRDSNNRLKQFENFVNETCVILPVTLESVEISSKLYAELRKKGTPVDDIDLFIAGIAIENNLAIATNNNRHFGKIDQIKVENWTKPVA